MYCDKQGVPIQRSRGLMDKALASGAGDCGFESHRDRFSFYLSFPLWFLGQEVISYYALLLLFFLFPFSILS